MGQRRVLESNKRFTVCSAGRRFGKSEIGGHRLLTHAFEAYARRNELVDRGIRQEYWIVGPNYSDSEKEFRVLWNELLKQEVPFDRPGTYNDPIGGNLHISLWGGRFQVHGKSAAHPESLVGEGLHGAIIAEAAKVKEKVWTKYVRPTLNDYKGWAMMTSTPEGKNWFYEMWKRGQDPSNPAWESWRMPAWVNPYVYPQGATDEGITSLRAALSGGAVLNEELAEAHGVDPEVAQLIGDLTQETFNQEIAALFTEFVGRVFKDFDEEVHVGDLRYNPEWETFAAVDYGFTNPNVWLVVQVDPFGTEVNVIGEVYEAGLTAVEFADEIQRRGLDRHVQAMYPDPASPGDTRILEQKLRVKARGGTGGELKHRIDAIREALKQLRPHLEEGHPERRPRLMIDRGCTQTIRDFLDYRYPDRKDEQDKNAPENPVKKNDHAPEALGRFFAGHFGTQQKQARRARVSSATMSRRG